MPPGDNSNSPAESLAHARRRLVPNATVTRSLGEELRAFRHRQRWSVERMALRLGVPGELYQRWEADVDLPTAPQMHAICDLVEQTPTRVMRWIRESGRRLLHDTVAETAGVPMPRAARRRGETGEEDGLNRVAMDLPLPLRRQLAESRGAAADDPAGIAAALRSLSYADEDIRLLDIEGMVAALTLEDRDALPSVDL